MRDITLDAQLDWLLAEWHHHCRNHQLVAAPRSCPQFRNARSSKGWDTTDEILDDEVNRKQMEAISTAVFQMGGVHRLAIYAVARNLSSGASVWSSQGLPEDRAERAAVIAEAREMLTKRLIAAGVMEYA